MNLTQNCILAILFLSASVSAFAQTGKGIDHPVTKAVLEVYEKQLRENPEDYMTRFRRANEYYRHNEYMRALKDIDEALKYAPASDTDLRFQAYMLRAGIYNQTLRPTEALADLNSAVTIDPKSYSAIYQRANTEYELEKYADAKTDFSRLRSLNTRSIEALIGLARIAVKENNLGLANEYLDQAVAINPNNAEAYTRRASVRKLMGNDTGAVEDLILSISTSSESPKALSALVDYGNTNYQATITGLTNAITQAPNVPVYRYLRAVIEQAHYRYLAAIDDFEKILNDNNYNYHGIYASIAECQYSLSFYDKALDYLNKALSMTSDVAEYHILLSKIYIASGRADDAVEASAKALAIAPSNIDALMQMGVSYIAAGNPKEASNLFGEAIMTDAEVPLPIMWRAMVMNKYLNQPVAATQNYEKVADMEHFYIDNVRSLKGFALLFIGRNDEAQRWMENILKTVPDHDGLINYYAACFYAIADDHDRALECAERALSLGYSNYHNWIEADDAGINMGSLRDDLRFLNLINRYSAIFGRQ